MDNIHNLLKDMNARLSGTQRSTGVHFTQQNELSLLLRNMESKVDGIRSLVGNHCVDVTRDQMLSWFSEAKAEEHRLMHFQQAPISGMEQ